MNQEQSKVLGALLRQKRMEMGYSMTQLAQAAGVRDSTVLRFERGEFASPSPGKLARFAAELRIDLADLFAKAGYLVPDELPGFDSYLSAKYPGLSNEAKAELGRHFDELLTSSNVEFAQPSPIQESPDASAGAVL